MSEGMFQTRCPSCGTSVHAQEGRCYVCGYEFPHQRRPRGTAEVWEESLTLTSIDSAARALKRKLLWVLLLVVPLAIGTYLTVIGTPTAAPAPRQGDIVQLDDGTVVVVESDGAARVFDGVANDRRVLVDWQTRRIVDSLPPQRPMDLPLLISGALLQLLSIVALTAVVLDGVRGRRTSPAPLVRTVLVSLLRLVVTLPVLVFVVLAFFVVFAIGFLILALLATLLLSTLGTTIALVVFVSGVALSLATLSLVVPVVVEGRSLGFGAVGTTWSLATISFRWTALALGLPPLLLGIAIGWARLGDEPPAAVLAQLVASLWVAIGAAVIYDLLAKVEEAPEPESAPRAPRWALAHDEAAGGVWRG